MKRTLLSITTILVLSSISYSQSKVNVNNLVHYGDKWFKENDDTPFSGIVFDMSKETGNKILESKYIQGIPHGKYSEWYNNGEKKVDGTYKSGMMDGKCPGFWKHLLYGWKKKSMMISMTVINI